MDHLISIGIGIGTFLLIEFISTFRKKDEQNESSAEKNKDDVNSLKLSMTTQFADMKLYFAKEFGSLDKQLEIIRNDLKPLHSVPASLTEAHQRIKILMGDHKKLQKEIQSMKDSEI